MLHLSEAEEARYAELQLTALDFARHGEGEPLESMLRSGLPVNLADGRGNTLLMLSAYNGYEECVSMLLRYGADIEKRNDHGQTPLAGVAFKGHLNVCKLLVKAGADINATSGMGATPLVFATMFGRRDTAEYLAQFGDNKRSFYMLCAAWVGKLMRLFRRLSK